VDAYTIGKNVAYNVESNIRDDERRKVFASIAKGAPKCMVKDCKHDAHYCRDCMASSQKEAYAKGFGRYKEWLDAQIPSKNKSIAMAMYNTFLKEKPSIQLAREKMKSCQDCGIPLNKHGIHSVSSIKDVKRVKKCNKVK
jgi:hypothetical protein